MDTFRAERPKAKEAAIVSYLGLEVTPETQFALRQLPKLESIDLLLTALLQHVGGVPPTPESFRQLQRGMSLDSHTAGGLFSGADWLIRTSMRSSLQPKALADELADLKVPAHFVQPLVRAITQGCASSPRASPPGRTRLRATGTPSEPTNRARRRRAILSQRDLGGLPSLQELRWRLDVRAPTTLARPVLPPSHPRLPLSAPPSPLPRTCPSVPDKLHTAVSPRERQVSISSSDLHRVLRPHLTLQCELSDGSTHAFHASKQARAPRPPRPAWRIPRCLCILPARHCSGSMIFDTRVRGCSTICRQPSQRRTPPCRLVFPEPLPCTLASVPYLPWRTVFGRPPRRAWAPWTRPAAVLRPRPARCKPPRPDRPKHAGGTRAACCGRRRHE